MKTQFRKLNQGFTIIEVLIVLAIAGLILAIVFLAVPALQRSSRNTAIKSDSANLLAAVNDYISNNSGALPTLPVTQQTGPVICFGTAAVAPCAASESEAKVRGGTTTTLIIGACGGAPAALGQIDVHTGCKCSTNVLSVLGARALAAQFLIEGNSGGPTGQCIDS